MLTEPRCCDNGNIFKVNGEWSLSMVTWYSVQFNTTALRALERRCLLILDPIAYLCNLYSEMTIQDRLNL